MGDLPHHHPSPTFFEMFLPRYDCFHCAIDVLLITYQHYYYYYYCAPRCSSRAAVVRGRRESNRHVLNERLPGTSQAQHIILRAASPTKHRQAMRQNPCSIIVVANTTKWTGWQSTRTHTWRGFHTLLAAHCCCCGQMGWWKLPLERGEGGEGGD